MMELEQFLSDSKAAILADWERTEQQLPHAAGSRLGRRASLQAILDQVLESLKAAIAGQPVFFSQNLLELHALERLTDGMDLHAVGAELARLRDIVIDHLADAAQIPCRTVKFLNQVFDRAILSAIRQYTESREQTLVALDHFFHEATGRTNLEELLPLLLQTLQQTAPLVSFVAVLLRDGEMLRGGAQVGLPTTQWRHYTRRIGEGFSGRIAQEHRPMEIREGDSLSEAERGSLSEAGARTLYGVPLLHDGHVVGVAKIGSRTAEGFSGTDKLFFRTLASRVTALLVLARVTEEHRRSEELLQTVLDNAPAIIHVKDKEGRYLIVNRLLEQFAGRSRAEFLGHTPHDIYPEKVAAKFLSEDQEVLSTGRSVTVEETAALPNGLRTFVSWKYPLHDAHGKPYAVAGISTDITERAKAEREHAELLVREQAARAEAEQSRALLDTFFASAPVGLAYYNRDLRYVRINSALARMHGEPAEAHLGHRPSEVYAEQADAIEAILKRTLETGEAICGTPAELEVPPGSGRRLTVQGDVFPVRGADGSVLGVGVAVMDVTERARLLEQVQAARAEAERSLAFMNAVFASSPFGFAVIDHQFRYLQINQLVADLNQLPMADHAGRTVRDVAPMVADEIEAAAREVFDTGTPIVGRELRFNGPPAPKPNQDWMINVYPVRTAGGEVLGVGIAVFEITAQKQAEAVRERLLGLLQAVLDQMPEGVLICEAPTGHVLLGNRQMERITGYRSDAGEGNSTLEYWNDQVVSLEGTPLRLEEYPLWRAIKQGESTFGKELLIRRSDGVFRRFSINVAPVQDSDGNVLAGVAVLSDVTEQRAAEERARFLTEATAALSSSLDFRTTLAKVANLAVPRIADWCLVYMEEEAEAGRYIAVAHRDPARTKEARELLDRLPLPMSGPGPTSHALRTGVAQLIENVTDEQLVASARTPEHLAFLRRMGLKSALILPLIARGQKLGVVNFMMTEPERRFTAEDVELAEELVRRAAMAMDNARLYKAAQDAIRARDEFLSIASHDLRSPLSVLRLQASLLLQTTQLPNGGPPNETAITTAKAIDRQVARIASLLEALLDVTRIQTGRLSLELEQVDLAALTRDVVERMREMLRSADCELSLEAALPVTGRWDRLRLEQVLTNLVSNAAKYGARRPVEISVTEENGWARLRVADHGIGIAPEHLPKLFQPFERVGNKRAIGGTGLGLWIVKQIVEAMRGHIDVESKPGQGSTFTVVLPVNPDACDE